MSDNHNIVEEYHPQQTPSPSPTMEAESKSPNRFRINKRLLPIKGYYFVFMAAVGDLLPFISVYMKQLGLNTQETGIIYGIMPFVGFFMRPLIGAVADRFKKHKLTLIFVTFLTGLFYMLLVAVPARPGPVPIKITTSLDCNTQDSYLRDCEDTQRTSDCDMSLTQFANCSLALNRSQLQCSLHCQVMPDGRKSDEFRACFTNDTGPYNIHRCNGTLNRGKHLDFVIPNLEAVMAREVARDRYSIDSIRCRDYDLKDVILEQNFSHEAWQILCERDLELICTVDCFKSLTKTCEISSPFDKTFFIFFFIFLIANITFAPIFPILDAAAYDALGEKRHLWGLQRVWGTFGFALFAVTATFIMNTRKKDTDIDYSVSFYLFFPLSVIAAAIAYFFKMSSDIKCGQFVQNVWKLLSYIEVSTFLLIVMFFGMLTGGLEAFLFWYLLGLGSSPVILGLILLVNCCSEVPLLSLAGAIIQRTGLVACLYLALFAYSVRLLIYSLLQDPWFILLIEPVHGVTFALMYAAASSYASIIAPPGMAATVQGLLGGMHFGFGKGIGSLVTGYLYEWVGPRWTWRIYSIVSIVLLVIYVLLNMFVFKPHHRPPGVRKSSTSNAPSPEEQVRQEENLLMDGEGHTPSSVDERHI